MSTAADYAAAVWAAGTRTLAAGVPADPVTVAEEYAAAVWAAGTRTLTAGETYTIAGTASGTGDATATATVTIPGVIRARLRRWPFWLSIPQRIAARGPTRFASTASRTGPDPHRSGVST